MENYGENAGDSSSSASSFLDESNGENQLVNHEQHNLVEHSFMSQAKRTQAHGTALIGAHNSTRNLMGNTTENHFPTSNLRPEFRLDLSSRFQFPQTEQGNWIGSSLGNPNWINWQHFSQFTHEVPATNFGSQGFGFQALMNQAMASDLFHLNHDRPIQQRIMNRQDPNLHLMEWLSLRESNQRQNIGVPSASVPRSRITKNKLYDPAFAAMGLPVDPHLRMFHVMNAKKAKKDGANNNEEDEDH